MLTPREIIDTTLLNMVSRLAMTSASYVNLFTVL